MLDQPQERVQLFSAHRFNIMQGFLESQDALAASTADKIEDIIAKIGFKVPLLGVALLLIKRQTGDYGRVGEWPSSNLAVISTGWEATAIHAQKGGGHEQIGFVDRTKIGR